MFCRISLSNCSLQTLGILTRYLCRHSILKDIFLYHSDVNLRKAMFSNERPNISDKGQVPVIKGPVHVMKRHISVIKGHVSVINGHLPVIKKNIYQ